MRKKICEFRSKNIKENNMTFIEIEFYQGNWWYVNFYGDRSYKYKSIEEAKDNIIEIYGKCIDFKILI